MLLLIDVGNTSIGFCVSQKNQLQLIGHIPTGTADLENQLQSLTKRITKQVSDVVVSSVVPGINEDLKDWIQKNLNRTPYFIQTSWQSPIQICLENSETLGVDRFVTSVAAQDLFPNQNLIVIDFGTATTYDFIDDSGNFTCGVICPGIGICTDALFQKAAQLPRISMEKPAQLCGKNTMESIASGVFYSKVGEIEYLVRHIKKEQNAEDCLVVATGGYSKMMMNGTKEIQHFVPQLIYHGMKTLYQQNINS